jgi:hypothetical protein
LLRKLHRLANARKASQIKLAEAAELHASLVKRKVLKHLFDKRTPETKLAIQMKLRAKKLKIQNVFAVWMA